jgi:hypothetical protein
MAITFFGQFVLKLSCHPVVGLSTWLCGSAALNMNNVVDIWCTTAAL